MHSSQHTAICKIQISCHTILSEAAKREGKLPLHTGVIYIVEGILHYNVVSFQNILVMFLFHNGNFTFPEGIVQNKDVSFHNILVMFHFYNGNFTFHDRIFTFGEGHFTFGEGIVQNKECFCAFYRRIK